MPRGILILQLTENTTAWHTHHGTSFQQPDVSHEAASLNQNRVLTKEQENKRILYTVFEAAGKDGPPKLDDIEEKALTEAEKAKKKKEKEEREKAQTAALGAAAGAAGAVMVANIAKQAMAAKKYKALEAQGDLFDQQQAMQKAKEPVPGPPDPAKEEEAKEEALEGKAEEVLDKDEALEADASGELATFSELGARALLKRWGIRKQEYDKWSEKAYAEIRLLKKAQKDSRVNLANNHQLEATDEFPILQAYQAHNYGPANEKAIGTSLWADHAGSIAAQGMRAAVYAAQQAGMAAHLAAKAVNKATELAKHKCMTEHEPRGFL
mmetsp:Transcript_110897/g.207906  ORF Transcript_110897/g.207906 Transcript_110897/m.207906 type:complete len:324 (+) Transcript_110897:134-1105(+)